MRKHGLNRRFLTLGLCGRWAESNPVLNAIREGSGNKEAHRIEETSHLPEIFVTVMETAQAYEQCSINGRGEESPASIPESLTTRVIADRYGIDGV